MAPRVPGIVSAAEATPGAQRPPSPSLQTPPSRTRPPVLLSKKMSEPQMGARLAKKPRRTDATYACNVCAPHRT